MTIGLLIPAGLMMKRHHSSTDAMARPNNLQDLMRIMICIWNESLHGWRVDRSNRCSHWEFLHTDHWIPHPKSWEHDNVHIICFKT